MTEMGIYSRGRPKKVDYDGSGSIPHSPGEYRIRDAEKNIKYVGETNDLGRRAREHKKTGKFGKDSTLEYMVANDWTTSADRRRHERRSIEKHKPYMNKSKGGEGRPAFESYAYETLSYDSQKPSIFIRLVKGLFKLIRWIIKAGIVLVIIAAIIFFVWSYL